MTIEQITEQARQGFAWPGGYELFFVTEDGGILCHKCVRAEIERIAEAICEDSDDGWRVTGSDNAGNLEEPLHCDNCADWIVPSTMDDDEFETWLEGNPE